LSTRKIFYVIPNTEKYKKYFGINANTHKKKIMIPPLLRFVVIV